MTTYGLTTTGFVRKTFNDIQDEMITEFQASFGNDFATNQLSTSYIMITIFVDALAQVWEQLELLYNSLFPDTAEGLNLTRNASLVGVSRIKAKKSIVRDVELENDSGAEITIPAGSRTSQSTNGKIWTLINDVVIPASSVELGDFECSEVGQNYCSIGSLDTILDFISGWARVENTLDVTVGELGRLEETDEELRIRRDIAIKTPSSASGVAIANKLLDEVDNCIYANYRDNDTETTDINGLPPHSLEMFVLGGTDEDIAETIAKYKPAGIATHGGNTETVTDSLGNSIDIKWSSLSQLDIYFRLDIETNGDWDNAYLDDIKDLIVNYINNEHTFNSTLYTWKYYTLLDNLIGVDNITIYTGLSSNPSTTANITPSVNEKPYCTPSNFTVNYV